MRSLRELLFGPREEPPHVKDALDAASDASLATEEAHEAVSAYWEARKRTASRAVVRTIDAYEKAEHQRIERRHR